MTKEKEEKKEEKVEAWLDEWNGRIGALAQATGREPKEIELALRPVVGDPSDHALKALESNELTPFGDLRDVLVDKGGLMPLATLRQYMPVLRGKAPQLPATVGGGAVGVSGAFDILPTIKGDESLTTAIKTGGILKVKQPLTVLLANRAGVADRYGLFDVPNKLVELMDRHAEAISEPCGKDFYEMMELVRQRRYAEVLSAFGISAKVVTNTRKNDLLKRVKSILWPSLYNFHRVLLQWKKSWLADMGENQMLAFVVALSQRTDGEAMPEDMATPPDTGTLYDAAEDVNDGINNVFSGMRLPVAAALAQEATEIKKFLDKEALPASIGAGNKDEMLKLLGISASASDIRLEQSLAQYSLSILNLPDWRGQKNEYKFLAALLQLGQQIKWDELLGGRPMAGGPAPRPAEGRRPIGTVTVEVEDEE